MTAPRRERIWLPPEGSERRTKSSRYYRKARPGMARSTWRILSRLGGFFFPKPKTVQHHPGFLSTGLGWSVTRRQPKKRPISIKEIIAALAVMAVMGAFLLLLARSDMLWAGLSMLLILALFWRGFSR